MRKDSRLSRVLHALIHLEAFDEPMSSEKLSQMLVTNPVVVRRIMALLKKQGFVQSTKGQNGGWTLAKALKDITLFDVYLALGEKTLFTIGLTDEYSACPIEQSVNGALNGAMEEAEALLLKRFGEVTLDSIAFDETLKAHLKQSTLDTH